MTPEQLKASILQYAFQGKLVPQNIEEGNGKELYSSIKEIKEKLTKEKKIKKEKPLDEISEDEIPFDIPENWTWVRVGDMGSWASGATPSRTNPAFYGGNIPWLKTGDLNDGYIDDVPEYITELALEKTSVRLNPEGSVLMAMYGATIGKLSILNTPMTTNQACCACITFDGVFNRYLFYFLMSQRPSYIGMAEGGAQPNISKEKIVASVMPLPPLAEQHRIVAKIEEMLPFVDRYAASYEKLEQFNAKFPEDMKKSILQYAIQGKLVEQRPEEGTAEDLYKAIQDERQKLIKEGKIKKEKPFAEITEDEIPFDIPDNWKWVRVNEICSILNGDRGKNYPAKSTLQKEGIPFISALNLDGKTVKKDENLLCLSDEQYNKLGNGKLVQNDIVVCIRGSLGKHGRYPFEKGAIASSLVICRPYSTNDILADYFMMYLDAPLFYSLIKLYDNGTAQPNLAAKSFEQFLLPLPPIKEQQRILQKVNEMLPYCERLVK
ncbi:MAG: restriction endonuclease subunit S [Lachnospiraceae bacterium]|nr:restriction endonuclease subunit S [Lachnospiraceae bacterium]